MEAVYYMSVNYGRRPAMVHYSESADVLEQRRRVIETAYAAHPESFARASKIAEPPSAFWINLSMRRAGELAVHDAVLFLPAECPLPPASTGVASAAFFSVDALP